MNEGQLRALDDYFRKLQGADRPFSGNLDGEMEFTEKSHELKSKQSFETLDAYLGKVKGGTKKEDYVLSKIDEATTRRSEGATASPDKEDVRSAAQTKPKVWVKRAYVKEIPHGSQALQQFDDASDLYLIGIIASLNIAVFLFEIASPIKSSELELFSIPLLYGAKINQLIVTGEWWRLVTPMFLHSGVFHMALGCWALLTFGPKVCRGYGPFTFFLIYLLGGISGNLTSFLHTPELTVGGTGPIFAMIGAWLIYQMQNKDVIGKDVLDSMFQKAIFTTALSFLLSNFGPIDDWTHFGAAVTGIIYGFFTCPILQMDDASSNSGREEGIALVRRYADPCKSVLVFVLSILVLASLAFLVEPPLSTLTENFV
ncbi:hypothetical protein CRG98_009789 [Punica granatum]|nr:hypothetical protein CRG98_009789 [Punica granatum]